MPKKGGGPAWGPYVVHASVLLLLAGALAGSILGFEGFVNIAENDTVDRIRLRRTGRILPLEFAVRLDKAQTTYYESDNPAANKTPKEYLATLTILEQDKPVLTRDVMVNHPLTYKGVRFYLSNIGDIPGEPFTLAFESQKSKMAYMKEVKIGQSVDIPENLGRFHLKEMVMEGNFQGHSIGQTLVGEITRKDQKPVQVLIPLKFPTFDRMRRGEVVVSVADFEKRYYTGLQVNNDPGVALVYTGFLLMIAGCLITFFIFHQRVMVEVRGAKKGGFDVKVAAAAGRGRLGMEKRVEILADRLARDLNGEKPRP